MGPICAAVMGLVDDDDMDEAQFRFVVACCAASGINSIFPFYKTWLASPPHSIHECVHLDMVNH